jgi:ubiquinone/menaquinone biosynthesis C-methylase UbiE
VRCGNVIGGTVAANTISPILVFLLSPTKEGAGMTSHTPPLSATDRLRELLDPQRCNDLQLTEQGYVDVLGDRVPPTPRIVHRLMHTEFYSTGYQRGRGALRRVTGLTAPQRSDDRARILAGLQLHPGATVIDVGCGPGNFTGLFGAHVGATGLAVGVDASHPMLRRATIDNVGTNVAYLRADAQNLPFANDSADAAACLMALYLIEQPFKTLDEIARALRPGGRIVILTSLAPGRGRKDMRSRIVETVSGCRMFDRSEIVEALRLRGFTQIEQHAGGLSQTVTAVRTDQSQTGTAG